MDRSSHLSVILDLCPTQWSLSAKPSNTHPLSFDTFLSHLLVFLNSHIAYKHENSLAVFGALPGKRSVFPLFSTCFCKLRLPSVLFYSSEEAGDPSTVETVQPDPNSYRFFKTLDQSLVQRISREFDILGQPDTEGTSYSLPLVDVHRRVTSRTLRVGWSSHQGDMLYVPHTLSARHIILTTPDINRLLHPAQTLSSPEDAANLPEPRILILSVSPDASNSYIPIMNSIFSAQKLVSSASSSRSTNSTFIQKITLDVCKIFGPDSVFLQQAAYLTGGSYIYLEHREALLQYLIVRSSPRRPSFFSTHKRVLDVILAHALYSQNHHHPNGRQDGFPSCLLLPQAYRRRWIRLLGLPFQFSAFGFPTHVPLFISSLPVFCQPVPVCSTCR